MNRAHANRLTKSIYFRRSRKIRIQNPAFNVYRGVFTLINLFNITDPAYVILISITTMCDLRDRQVPLISPQIL